MKRVIISLSVFFLISSVFAWSHYRRTKLEEKIGGLYSIEFEPGEYRIAKILALDPGVVHLRIYKQSFSSRPASVDSASLTLGTIHDKDGFGLGHLPVTPKQFAYWEPVFLRQEMVKVDELDGYKMWKESKGGAFGSQ